MMKGTGPVEVAGLGTVTADNVVRVTLSDAYARFPNDRTARQEVLADVARAVFTKLVTGDYPSLRPLATALVTAVAERRVILHMARDEDQRHVTALQVDGRLPSLGPDFALLTVQNFAGNKLDYYLDTSVRVTGNRRPGALGQLRAEIEIRNTAPPGQTSPAYVFGPFNQSLRAGQYAGLASLYLPQGSSVTGSSGDLSEGPPALSSEAGRTVITVPLRIDAGQTARITLDLKLPPGPGEGYEFVLIPVSRVRPTTYTVDLARGGGRVRYNGPVIRQVALTDAA
jgi:hypothetical protein